MSEQKGMEENTIVLLPRTDEYKSPAKQPILASAKEYPMPGYFDPVCIQVLLDYLLYEKEQLEDKTRWIKWKTEPSLLKFFNLGEGNGTFRFTAGDLSAVFQRIKHPDNEITKLLVELSVNLYQEGTFFEIPFWAELQNFISVSDDGCFQCHASLLVKDDGVNGLAKEYPWTFFAFISYNNVLRLGEIRLIDYHKK